MAQDPRTLWAKRVERWKDSGLTVKEFAAEIGVNANTLSNWSWKLRKERSVPVQKKSRKPKQPARKKPAKKSAPDPIQFIEVAQPQEASDARFEIALRRGHRLFVPTCFNADALGRLVDVLEAR